MLGTSSVLRLIKTTHRCDYDRPPLSPSADSSVIFEETREDDEVLGRFTHGQNQYWGSPCHDESSSSSSRRHIFVWGVPTKENIQAHMHRIHNRGDAYSPICSRVGHAVRRAP